MARITPLSSSPLPERRIGQTPAAPTVVEAPKPQAIRGPEESKASALPRNRTTLGSFASDNKGKAVTAVLLGIQGLGVLVGAPAAAHAAVPDVDALADMEGLLAEAGTVDASTMDADALRAARRALWTSYVDATTGAPHTALTASTESADPYEARWNAAADGSIDAKEVKTTLAELGSPSTDKLVGMLDAYKAKFSDAGRLALQTEVTRIQIGEAAADGKLTKAELTTIEQTLATTFGEANAKAALLRAFPDSIQHLDSEAAGHLLERMGSMETHVGRLNDIADEMISGKNTLFDANFDGKIDAKDLVFTTSDSGKVTVKEIGQKLSNEVKIATAMADASYNLDSAGVSFQLIKNHKANPDFWTIGHRGTLVLKPGVSPSDALKDVLENPGKYGYECATGLVMVYYQAMLDVLGPKDFDAIAKDLRIGPWDMENDLDRALISHRPNAGKGTETDLGEYKLTPGHYYYFRNWDVTDDARARGWQGENVIYLGGGQFYGHGIGLGSADIFVSKLASEMKEGGKTPSLLNSTQFLSTTILKHDKHPGE